MVAGMGAVMSVLNKMLRDLEQRQYNPATSQQVSIAPTTAFSLWRYLLLGLCFLLLCFAVYALLIRPPAAVTAVANTMVVEPEPLQTAPAAATPENIAVLHQPAPVQPVADQLDTGLPPATITPVEKVMPRSEETKPAQPAATKTAGTVAANIPQTAQLQVERTVVTVQQQAISLQQRALVAAQAGRIQQALQYWQQLQQLTPDLAAPYLEQARLWTQLGQQSQATLVLQQAISRNISDADIQLLLAQQAAASAQWQQVDDLLPADFAVAQQLDYYGLKAAALQQLGQHQAALNWFSQLIILQPQQARWWLGAAISLDAQALPQRAHEHYRQALQWGDSLSVASRNYIQQRLVATE
jgi:MSHA biogenesis protein MshN